MSYVDDNGNTRRLKAPKPSRQTDRKTSIHGGSNAFLSTGIVTALSS